MSEPKFATLKAAAEKIVTSMRPSERDVYEFDILATPETVMEVIEAYRALLHNYEVATKWIPVSQELPPADKNHCWLAWITCQNKDGGYTDLVSYGTYVCHNDDIRPGDKGYVDDNDDGNYKQSGWYREEETHGGEFDYVFVNLNGKVTHWKPRPAPPEASLTPPAGESR